MLVRTPAIILRRYDYSESSQVAHVYTREEGRVSILGKGSKKPSSMMKGPIDALQVANVVYRTRQGSPLRLLTRYEPLHPFDGLRSRLDRLYSAFYLAELLSMGSREFDADAELFDVWLAAWVALDAAPRRAVPAVVTCAELAFGRRCGFGPSLAACARCGREASPRAPAVFRPADGGVICRECRGSNAGIDLAPAHRRRMSDLAACSPTDAARTALSRAERDAIRTVQSAWVLAILERPLESAPFAADPLRGYQREVLKVLSERSETPAHDSRVTP